MTNWSCSLTCKHNKYTMKSPLTADDNLMDRCILCICNRIYSSRFSNLHTLGWKIGLNNSYYDYNVISIDFYKIFWICAVHIIHRLFFNPIINHDLEIERKICPIIIKLLEITFCIAKVHYNDHDAASKFFVFLAAFALLFFFNNTVNSIFIGIVIL